MKADEVMLGDLVSLGGVAKHVTLAMLNTWSDDIKPIPLTPEILEKNGFETVAQKAAEPCYWQFFDNETGNVVNAFRRIFRGLWVECSNATTESSANKQCEYVHELQHALKLCEIEKEVVV